MRLNKSRPGLSLAELLIGMVILAIVGMGLTRIMVTQARYFDHQKKSNAARNVSRGPLNRIVSDLRMVEALGGVVSATSTAITVRVPYAIGVVCVSQTNGTQVSLLPVDSAMFAGVGYTGYAWRNGAGKYGYVEVGGLNPEQGDVSLCNTALVTTLTAEKAKVVRINPPLTDTASVGTPVFLYRKITYEFKNSTILPGTIGLYRTVVTGGSSEELSAPYASGAKFRFFVGSSQTAQDAVPAQLSTLRGLELVMTGTSEKIPIGGTQQEQAPFTTAVFFKNRLN